MVNFGDEAGILFILLSQAFVMWKILYQSNLHTSTLILTVTIPQICR